LDDSFIAVWDNIDSFDPSRSSFKNRCAGLAKYKAIDALRKEIRHQAVSTDQIGEISYEDRIDLGEADEILKNLKDDDKIIFKKLFLEGYSYDDISKDSGLSKEVLYNRVSRAKKVIRLNLKEK
jgi:RNA polymerase sigma factor (sigma-70 family)